MSRFALELDDRAVALAADGNVLSSAPSAVFDGTAGTTIGANAWRELRVRPRSTSTRHLGALLTQRGTSARAEALLEAELKQRLAEQPMGEGQRMWIVSPAQAEAAGLTALLGITRRMGLLVDGFIDSATVTTAALGSEQNTIVLELGLHHAAATSVDCIGSQARRRRAVHSERGGLIELYQAWLDLVSTTMVKRTRFDPLHDAATEQHVFELIRALALEAANAGSAIAKITKGADSFEVALTRDQFAQAAQPIYRAIVSLLHQLRPAGAAVSIVMPQLAALLPGLREQLEQFVGCELVAVPDGFAAAATSQLALPAPLADENAVVLLRRIPRMMPEGPHCRPPRPAQRCQPRPRHCQRCSRHCQRRHQHCQRHARRGRRREREHVPRRDTDACVSEFAGGGFRRRSTRDGFTYASRPTPHGWTSAIPRAVGRPCLPAATRHPGCGSRANNQPPLHYPAGRSGRRLAPPLHFRA
jgi:hypothetical protein